MKNIYLFVGEEPLTIQKRIDRIIRDEKIDDFNVVTYDMSIDKLEDVISDCLMIPFMSDAKAIIMKNPLFLTKAQNIKDYAFFMDYLKKPMESTLLMINACGLTLDESKEYVTELKKKEFINVKKPSNIEMNGWLKMICKYSGVEIKEEAIREFFSICSYDDLAKCKIEVEKLINYVDRGGVITQEDVDNLLVKSLDDDVFSLSKCIIARNREQAFLVYQDLTRGTTDVVSLINQIASTMRMMYAVSILLSQKVNQNQIASRLSIKPGYCYNLVNNVHALDQDIMKKYIVKLSELDYQIKSGQVNPKTGFEFFLLSI